MVRILIFIIIAAIVLSLTYFLFKTVPIPKKMLFAGGSLAAAGAGLFLQMSFPIYMALLVIVAVSLLVTLAFMKLLEKEKEENRRLLDERKARKPALASESSSSVDLAKEDDTIPDNTIEENSIQENTIEENSIQENTVQDRTNEEDPEEKDTAAPTFGMESIDPEKEER